MTLGWWAGTYRPWDDRPDKSVAWDVFRALGDAFPGGSNLTGRSQWYGKMFARDDGALSAYYEGVGDARGSVMLSVRQSWFEGYAQDPVPLLRTLVAGWHVSRVDLAADVTSPARLTPNDLYALLPAARSRSRPANRTLTQDWAGGQKLTIGSRASDRYLRVYVKGDRVRHEVELKGLTAGNAWDAICQGAELGSVWRAEYGRVVEWR